VSDRVPDDVAATPVERAETEVMFLRTKDEPAEMWRGWERLEAVVGLHGRKFFGTIDPSTREYRVCVQVRDRDDPAALGLESGTLPGGRYLRARLRGAGSPGSSRSRRRRIRCSTRRERSVG
jgi:hypothetical protein